MTYLQLVQRLAREVDEASVPSTTVSATGEALNLCNWINTAWMDIQGLHQDWGWKRTTTSFVTVAAQATYTTAQAGTTNFGMWVKDQFRNYLTASGNTAEIPMTFMEYEHWRDVYQFGSNRTATAQPYFFTILPNKSIGLGPVPLVGYTVTADYFTCPTEMSADADEPALPTHYHMAIVYKAMMDYGAFEGASEVYQRGEGKFKALMHRIENDYLPEVEFAGAML